MWVLPTSQGLSCRTSAVGSHPVAVHGSTMQVLCLIPSLPPLTSKHTWALRGWTGPAGETQAGNYFCPVLVCLWLCTHGSWKLPCNHTVTCEILAPIIPISSVFAPLLPPVFTRQREGSTWCFTWLLHAPLKAVNGFAISGCHQFAIFVA